MLRRFGCFLLVTVVATLLVESAAAQYRLQYITISSGQDPISSGITGIARFTNGQSIAEFAVQHEQAWLIYGRQFSGNFNAVVAGSVGHFQEAPYVGPFITLDVPLTEIGSIPVSVGAITWPALFVWEPRNWKNDGVENNEPINLGAFGGVRLNVGPASLSYHLLNFMDDSWNELPGASVVLPVRGDLIVAGSATWNNNAEKWMLYMGITWSPK